MIFTIKKLLASGVLFLSTLLLAWMVGFGLFLYELHHQLPPPDNIHSDAIVVLTGGDTRVKEGIRLLDQGVSDKLLISGVGHGVTVDDILRASDYGNLLTDEGLRSRIVLDHTAANTKGNAEETSHWVTHHQVQSLRLVTSYYHMPRSRLEFHFMMPQIVILEHPVHGSALSMREHLRQAFIEYHKYIAVLLRQAGLWPS